jgi:hypothetical protein
MLGLGTGITSFGVSGELPALETGNPFLKLWLKYNTGITQISNALLAWDDQSGNSNNAIQLTASRQPEYDSGDIKFNISGDNDHRLDLTSDITLGQFTIICSLEVSHRETIGLMGSASDNCLRFHQGGDVDRISLLLPDTTDEDADMLNLTSDVPFRTKFVFTMIRSAGPDDNVVVRFDGSDVTDTNSGRDDSNPLEKFIVNDIGTAAGNFANWRGEINEVAIFNTAITDTTLLASIENDISTRSGV